MTALEKQHTYRITLTRCPRCEAQPGSHVWGPTWLNELTIGDGVQSVHALLCRRPSCGFAELRGLLAGPAETLMHPRRAWLRDAVVRHPLTFAAATLVIGVVVGLFVAFT